MSIVAPVVALVGMMGSGKSAVSRLLADRLKVAAVDLDAEIEKEAAAAIAVIFQTKGEAVFRQMESSALKTALAALCDGGIIATGGGIVLDAANRDLLRQGATVVYLQADAESLARRLADAGGNRPLLKVSADTKPDINHLRDMLSQREALYRVVADIVIEQTEEETPLQTTNNIIAALGKLKSDDNAL